MAKNVFQKKKRIAHFQAITDDFTKSKNEGEFSGCFDYVSSIIDNMDSSFRSMNSDCSRLRAKRKSMSNDESNTNSLNKPSSSHNGFSQNEKKLVKKFTVSRKFPLMEKSQKILRQIKHNRNISKPRAHLAGLPKSPVKTYVEEESSVINQKVSPKLVNKPEICSTKLSDISQFKSNDVRIKKIKRDCYKISIKKQNCLRKEGETNTSINLDRYSGNENLYDASNKLNTNLIIENNSLNGTKVLKDSENETSDSEYERFIKKNKKGLRKKVVKKQKVSATKKIKSVKKSKRVLKKNIRLEQYNSDKSDCNTDNDTPLPKNHKAYCFKKSKFTEVHVENGDEKSECNIIAHVFTQDPSSESEAESNKTDRTQPLEAKYLSSALQNTDSMQDLDTGSEATLPNVSAGNKSLIPEASYITVDNTVLQTYRPDVSLSACNPDIGSVTTLPDVSVDSEETAPETSHVTVDNVLLESYTPGVSLSHVRNSSNSEKTELNDSTSNLVIDLVSDSELEMGACGEYSTVSEQIDENKSAKGNLIGFTKNSDNCNNNVCKEINLATLNQDNLDSEESDIEIIDIVSIKPKNEYTLNLASNMQCCTDSKASGQVKDEVVENNVIGNSSRNSEVIVKTEKLSEITDIKNNPRAENNKYEAAYTTNICNDFSQDKLINFNQRALISIKGRELSETSSTHILPDDSALQKDIKQESESDDDVVFLETVEIATTSDFSSHKKIKTEVPGILMKFLECEKHSAHKILKMEVDNHSENYCEIPYVIKELNKNTKNKNVDTDVSNFKNTCSKELAHPKTRNNSFIKDELKSYMHSSSSILSSNYFGDIYKRDQGCIDLKNMDESQLIELYKREFDAYQEIVKTEVNVSADLKKLELRQAERVEYIRSLVQKYVANNHISSAKSLNKDCLKDLSSSPSITQTDILTSSKLVSDIKPNISNCDLLENVQQSTVMLKHEPESSQKYQNISEVKSNKNQTLKLLDEKCNVCGKEAMAACQRCAKVFFCSHECGRKFWIDGHVNECSNK